jgi:hypothetical protein
MLSQLLSGGAQKILIAGAADTGLLALVARAAPSGTGIVVLDRCETPLELCRRFAWRWSLPVETLRSDLMEAAPEAAFDIVLAHSLLQFIPTERRVDVLSRLRRSMRSGGRLALTFRTSSRIEGDLQAEYRQTYPTKLIEKLASMHIALPEPRDEFHRRIAAYAEERRLREGALSSTADVQKLINDAGLTIEHLAPLEANPVALFHQLTSKIAKQRFLAIAKPSV